MLLMARKGQDADRTIRYLRHGHVDGAVVVSHHQADDIEQMLLSDRMPCVFVGRPWYLPDQLSYVDTDNRLGAGLATSHLLERGRRRIGTVAGPADMIAAVDRVAGWSDALTARGLSADAIAHGDFTTEGCGGRPGAARPVPRPGCHLRGERPDGGGCAGGAASGRPGGADRRCAGGLRQWRGGAVTDPPLTTVVNPVVQMARTAGLVLLGRIMRDEPLGPPTIFPPELVVRASS